MIRPHIRRSPLGGAGDERRYSKLTQYHKSIRFDFSYQPIRIREAICSQNDRTRGINIAGPVKDSKIYNNTFLVGPGHHVDLVLRSDWNGWAGDSYFYNNIFYVEGSAQFSYALSRAPDGAYVTAPGFGQSKINEFDSNLYCGQVAPPEDAHAVTLDPKFLAPGQGGFGRMTLSGYHLQPGSPARRSGKVIEKNGGRDFSNNPVPACGGTDRGALQSQDCGAPPRHLPGER